MAQLVGRAAEVSRALAVLRRTAQRGDGAVLLVTGEAGIGKTAFLRTVADQATRLGYRAGIGKAEQIGQIAPGAPLLVALRSGGRPLLTAREFSSLAPVQSQPLWLIDRIADLLDSRAQQAPILIAIDDHQWADPLSRLALRALTGRMVGLPVVWLLTSRGDARQLAAELAAPTVEQVAVHTIPLNPLGQADIDAIATEILGSAPVGETRRRLRGTGGNPFLAVQFAEAVAHGPVGGTSRPPLPATLVAAGQARLHDLSPAARKLVQLVAVWGQPIDVRDAGALLASGSPDELTAWITEGTAADLLTAQGKQIAIRHDLISESVHAGIPVAARVTLHRQCAEYLLATGQGPLAAAPHMQESASPGDERAVAVLGDAAAEAVYALPETAAELMRQAFGLLPPGHPRWLGVGEQYAEALARIQHGSEVISVVDTLLPRTADPAQRARLQAVAAGALWLAGAPAEMTGRVDAALASTGVPAALRTRLAGFRALASTRTGTAQAAGRSARAVLAEARRLADRPSEQVALQALGEIARNELRHEEALTYFRALREQASDLHVAQETAALRLLDRFSEAEAVMDAASRAAGQRSDAVQPSLAEARMWQDFMLARFDEAEAGAQTLARLSDELGTSTHRLETAMVLTLSAITGGDLARARERLDEAERDNRSDRLVRSPRLKLIRSLLAMLDGDPGEAVRIVKPVMDRAASTRSYWPRLPEWMRVHAGMAVAAGDRDFARETAARATIAARRNPGVASLEGIAWQVEGVVGDDVGLLAKAVARLEQSPRPMLLASALADHGSLLLAQGDRQEAAAALQRAWSVYTQHGAVSWAAGVARTVRTAGIPVNVRASAARPSRGWAALTAAELAVANLISAGHTNRGAARALGISSNTVATHLRSIFAKLDVRSRVQLANAWHDR